MDSGAGRLTMAQRPLSNCQTRPTRTPMTRARRLGARIGRCSTGTWAVASENVLFVQAVLSQVESTDVVYDEAALLSVAS